MCLKRSFLRGQLGWTVMQGKLAAQKGQNSCYQLHRYRSQHCSALENELTQSQMLECPGKQTAEKQ